MKAGSETPGRNWKVDQLLLAEARAAVEETEKLDAKLNGLSPFSSFWPSHQSLAPPVGKAQHHRAEYENIWG